jgi:hypothetical protein
VSPVATGPTEGAAPTASDNDDDDGWAVAAEATSPLPPYEPWGLTTSMAAAAEAPPPRPLAPFRVSQIVWARDKNAPLDSPTAYWPAKVTAVALGRATDAGPREWGVQVQFYPNYPVVAVAARDVQAWGAHRETAGASAVGALSVLRQATGYGHAAAAAAGSSRASGSSKREAARSVAITAARQEIANLEEAKEYVKRQAQAAALRQRQQQEQRQQERRQQQQQEQQEQPQPKKHHGQQHQQHVQEKAPGDMAAAAAGAVGSGRPASPVERLQALNSELRARLEKGAAAVHKAKRTLASLPSQSKAAAAPRRVPAGATKGSPAAGAHTAGAYAAAATAVGAAANVATVDVATALGARVEAFAAPAVAVAPAGLKVALDVDRTTAAVPTRQLADAAGQTGPGKGSDNGKDALRCVRRSSGALLRACTSCGDASARVLQDFSGGDGGGGDGKGCRLTCDSCRAAAVCAAADPAASSAAGTPRAKGAAAATPGQALRASAAAPATKAVAAPSTPGRAASSRATRANSAVKAPRAVGLDWAAPLTATKTSSASSSSLAVGAGSCSPSSSGLGKENAAVARTPATCAAKASSSSSSSSAAAAPLGRAVLSPNGAQPLA